MTGLKAAQVFYFRARLVDRTGNIGPWSDWVYGQSSADADEILDYIAGQLTETELGQHLREEIERIAEIDGIQVALDAIETQFSELTGAEDWGTGNAYSAAPVVRAHGSV